MKTSSLNYRDDYACTACAGFGEYWDSNKGQSEFEHTISCQTCIGIGIAPIPLGEMQ